MKKLLTLIIFSFLLFIGCNQESEVTAPTTSSTNPSVEKQWITLPNNGSLSVEETFTKTKKNADGSRGWNIVVDHTFSNGVRTYGDLDCPKNAYDGKLTFSYTLSSDVTVIDFDPSPFTFNIPVEYTIIYEGLDLTGVNPEDVDFYYVAPGGALVKAEYTRLEVNIATGRLFVLDAKLPHFSRYGFVN
jgi:hypothetical protein